MKKLLTLLISAIYLSAIAYEPTKVTAERVDGINLSFVADKDYPGTQTAYLSFVNLADANYDNLTPVRIDQSGEFLKIEPYDGKNPVTYNSYTYRIYNGSVDQTPNTKIYYRLPYGEGKTARVVKLYDVMSKLYEKQNQLKHLNYVAYGFTAMRGDTIYAARRGVVVAKRDEVNKSAIAVEGNLKYTSKRPRITIEHEDGTQGTYSPLMPDQIFIDEGDFVECGDPIGIVGTFDNKSFQMRFWVSHYVTNPQFESGVSYKDIPYAIHKYIEPTFATAEGDVVLNPKSTYTSSMEEWMVVQEMNKRDLNKWAKQKGLSKKQISGILSDSHLKE